MRVLANSHPEEKSSSGITSYSQSTQVKALCPFFCPYRLALRGNNTNMTLAAVARKPLVLTNAIIRTGRPRDPELAMARCGPPINSSDQVRIRVGLLLSLSSAMMTRIDVCLKVASRYHEAEVRIGDGWRPASLQRSQRHSAAAPVPFRWQTLRI